MTTSTITKNEKAEEVLNDLIRINSDRTKGYQKAADEMKELDAELQIFFDEMAEQSTQYANELTKKVKQWGGRPTDGTTNKGKIYRIWMDLKATFTENDKKNILASCEFGEDAAQKAYEEALSIHALAPEIRQLISSQQIALKDAHNKIKKYRDTYKSNER